MSLRPKFMYLFVLMTMAVTVLFAAYGLLDTWGTQILQRKAVAELAVRIIDENLVESEDLASATRASAREFSHMRFFRAWIVADTGLNILHSEGSQDAEQLLRAPLLDALTDGTPRVSGNAVSAPIRRKGKVVGVFAAWLDGAAMSKSFPSRPIGTLIMVIILIVAFIMLVTYTAISARVLRPLERLSEGARRVAKGDYAIPVRATGARGEVAQLVEAFNDMVSQVRESRTDLEDKVRQATEKVVEQERQLAAVQRLTATGRLASGVAHEINNPLGGMMNAVKKLTEGKLEPSKREEYLNLVMAGLDGIKETVDRLLHFAPRAAAVGPVGLLAVADGAVSLVEHYAAERGVGIATDISESCQVRGDAGELKQVLVNLLINAIDASAKGGNVTVSSEIADGRVAVRVKDTGSGMTEGEVSRALELFYTTKEPGRGSGLGLPIVANIVERYSGEIRIDSKPGEGTTVTVELPLNLEEEEKS